MPITADLRKPRKQTDTVFTRIAPVEQKPVKRRAAGYARTSTSLDTQEGSLEAQREHLEHRIRGDPTLIFAGLYIEDGKSATHADDRPELQRLLSDCQKGLVDVVYCKSLSRFARDASDCIDMVRTLQALNVSVVFEREGIDTGRMESEFLMSILAGLAADESWSIRNNVKWGYKKRMEKGVFKYKRPPLGYDAVDGDLVVNPAEAETVKRIFNDILAGKGTRLIAKELNNEGVPTKYGKDWQQGTIRAIIKNITYTGDVLLQKTVRDEHFKQMRNEGQEDQFYIEEHHEPIVNHAVFNLANETMERRGKRYGSEKRKPEKTVFHRKLFCGMCGAPLHRNAGNKWICAKHVQSVCSMKPVYETDVQRAVTTAFNKLAINAHGSGPYIIDLYAEYANPTRDIIKALNQKLSECEAEKGRLVDLLSKGAIQPSSFTGKMNKVKTEEKMARQKLEKASVDDEAVRALRSYVRQLNPSEDFDPKAFDAHVEKVVITVGEDMEITFKCGLKVTERYHTDTQCTNEAS